MSAAVVNYNDRRRSAVRAHTRAVVRHGVGNVVLGIVVLHGRASVELRHRRAIAVASATMMAVAAAVRGRGRPDDATARGARHIVAGAAGGRIVGVRVGSRVRAQKGAGVRARVRAGIVRHGRAFEPLYALSCRTIRRSPPQLWRVGLMLTLTVYSGPRRTRASGLARVCAAPLYLFCLLMDDTRYVHICAKVISMRHDRSAAPSAPPGWPRTNTVWKLLSQT